MNYRIEIEPDPTETKEISNFLVSRWGAPAIARLGKLIDASKLSRVTARNQENKLVGLATFNIHGSDCELVTIDSTLPNQGIATKLISEVEKTAKEAGCTRFWLITTNNNIPAISLYTRREFRLVAVHLDAITKSRQLKPSIPLTDENGLPIRDELEFEKSLD